jgi:hypothetical protein
MGLASILWVVIIILVAIWLLGLIFKVAKRFIHVFILIAVIVVVYNLVFLR